MPFFINPAKLVNVYPHPNHPTRPLYFVIDPVHILTNIRNNWINKNPNQYLKYPDFKEDGMRMASFNALKQLHAIEKENILRYGYRLSLKALYPSSIERQNVMLVLQVFNTQNVVVLMEMGAKKQLESFEDTSTYISLVTKWWNVMNVKTPLKGKRLRDEFQQPVT